MLNILDLGEKMFEMFQLKNSGDVWEINIVLGSGRNKLTSDRGQVNSLLTEHFHRFRLGYFYYLTAISNQFQLTAK